MWCAQKTDNKVSKQGGQIAPVALFGILVLSVVMLVMYNAGQKLNDKSRLANAADAAAYSGAVWTARHLNFMAYTNRAMVANHVAVGHFISYISWFRYIRETIVKLDQYTGWIPIWGQYVAAVDHIVQYWAKGNDYAARIDVRLVDGLNAVYRAAQLETKASLAVGGLNDLMQKTAETYDPFISINSNSELGALPIELQAPLLVKINYQLVQLPRFIKKFTASDDSGRINQLITQSYQAEGDTSRWMAGNRGWKLSLIPGFFQARKYGATSMQQSDSGADWNASDELQFCTKPLFKKRWRCKSVVSEDASATEFYNSYSGIKSYYGLDGNPSDDHSLEIAAVASKRQTDVTTKDLMGVVDNRQPLMVASMAKVEFKRPMGFGFSALGGNKQEYASLFNPFWNAHLVAFPIPGFG